MKKGLLKAFVLTHKADRMTDKERYLLQQKRLKELISTSATVRNAELICLLIGCADTICFVKKCN